MKKLVGVLSLAMLVFICAACSVESVSKTESCTFNGRPVDCAQMPGPNQKPIDVPPPADPQPVQFACGSLSCVSDQQFCLRLEDPRGRYSRQSCIGKKETCTTCECVAEHAAEIAPAFCTQNRVCQESGVGRAHSISMTCWD